MDHCESFLPIGKTSWTSRATLICTLALAEGHCHTETVPDMVCIYCHLSWNGCLAHHRDWCNLKPLNQNHRSCFSNLGLGQVPRWLQHSSTLGQISPTSAPSLQQIHESRLLFWYCWGFFCVWEVFLVGFYCCWSLGGFLAGREGEICVLDIFSPC